MTCRTCNTTLTGNFCCSCGRPVQVARVDWHYIVHEVRHVLHFEKGIIHTVKELLFNPGPSIVEFITIDRSRLVKPVLFLIVTSLVYTTLEHFFHVEQGYIHYNDTDSSSIGKISSWVQDHYGYSNIVMGVLIAVWIKLIYRKYRYNFFEILILLCFVMGMGMLILSVSLILEGISKIPAMKTSGVLAVIYCTWGIGNFFDRTRISSYFKAFVSYLLGMATFGVFIILLGLLVDYIRH